MAFPETYISIWFPELHWVCLAAGYCCPEILFKTMVLAREESGDIPKLRHSLYLSTLQEAMVMVELGASRDWDTQNFPGF